MRQVDAKQFNLDARVRALKAPPSGSGAFASNLEERLDALE